MPALGAPSVNPGGSVEATFCFIDVAGYTALTETHGGIAAADLADEFRELLRIHVDPVCKMQVDTTHAAGDLHYNQKTYWFCSLHCAERFAKQPSLYV